MLVEEPLYILPERNRTWVGHHRPFTIGPIAKPKTHLAWSSVTLLGHRRMRALVFVYIIKEVAHAHAQKATIEWLSSTPGLGVMLRLLSEMVAYW